MITIVDYGLGNINAFANIYKRLNIPVSIAKQADDLSDSVKIILPGVGAFDYAMKMLNLSGMRPALEDRVKSGGAYVLGVCVGMQILAESSEEGTLPGLGWINARVKKFDVTKMTDITHLPHMGWNDVKPLSGDPLFEKINADSRFYFLHSFCMNCMDASDILAVADYGGDFCCAVKRGNIYGVQFHPEKSHHYGIQLLKNFAEL